MTEIPNVLSGRLLARNAFWNLLGMVLPLLVALWAIPVLIDGMGVERFGLMTVVWVAVGYFSLFDLGIGRAVTKLVAERLGTSRMQELPALIRTGLTLMWGLGLLAAVVVGLMAPWLSESAINMPDSLRPEALWSFWILAFTLPFVISSAGLIGILEAHQRFPQITAVRIPLGISNYVGPVLLLTYSNSLIAITAFIAVSRLIAWIGFRELSRRNTTLESEAPKFDRQSIRALLSFGGWITVSNVIGPLMVYFDRFLIGGVLSMSAVTFYTIPYEILTRLWLLPVAIMGVLFPAFASALATDAARVSYVFYVAGRFLLVVMAIPLGTAILFAPEALALWLGSEFASQSTTVARWLALGVYINCLARLPFIALQGHGRPDLTAKLHIVQAILFMPLLWWLIHQYGIAGAAAGWTARIAVDTGALFYMSGRLIPALRQESHRSLLITALAALFLALLWLPESLEAKMLTAALLFLVCGGLAWKLVRGSSFSVAATIYKPVTLR